MRFSDRIELGAFLKEKRLGAGFSCQSLANVIGVSKGFISQVENGKSGMDESTAIRVATVLGIDAFDIVESHSKEVEPDPAWLRFLMSEYEISERDKKVLMDIVRDSRVPLVIRGETKREFRGRWRQFYMGVQKFLSDPNNRFFVDPEVQYILSRLNISGTRTLFEVKQAFISLVDSVCGKSIDCSTMGEWKSHVCRSINIKIIDIAEEEYREYSRVNTERIELAKIMVMSSPKIYGATCKLSPNGSGYVFVGDSRGDKGLRGDYPFWHEVVRMLVDPELQTGKSISYIPDGVQRPPGEALLSRMAIWLAYHFPIGEVILEKIVASQRFSHKELQRVNNNVFHGATLRMTSMAISEASSKPLVYIDAQMRLKEAECHVEKINVADQRNMEKHADARLRIGFVFKNCAAERYGVGLRYNMRIGENSPILRAFQEKKECVGDESLYEWDDRYGLCGFCKTIAVYSARKNNVRALMAFEEGEG